MAVLHESTVLNGFHAQRTRTSLVRGAALAVVGLLTLAACGGGGSGGGESGSLDVRPVWPEPSGGISAALPSAVQTVRVVLDSEAGLHCCIAVDPATVPIDNTTGLRLLLLDKLPPGPATFSMVGFPTDFAPAPEGFTEICPTDPPDIGQACDTTRPATSSFDSPEQSITIIAGQRSQPTDITMEALPFVFDLHPAPGDSAPSPLSVAFAAAEAVTGIDGSSITVEALFRSLSKRISVQLSPCDDGSTSPCSQNGQLQVTGFHAVGTPVALPPGPASLRITARNLASPPRELDFTYDFTVLAEDQSAEQTPAVGTSIQSAASRSAVSQSAASAPDRPDTPAPGLAAMPNGAVNSQPARTPVPTRTGKSTPRGTRVRRATPTATPTSTAARQGGS